MAAELPRRRPGLHTGRTTARTYIYDHSLVWAADPGAEAPAGLMDEAEAMYTACLQAGRPLPVMELAIRHVLPRGVATVLARDLVDFGLLRTGPGGAPGPELLRKVLHALERH